MTTIAETGLQLYKFGKTASIPFWTENHKPESFFDYLEQNQSIGAHTLCLLDLDPENGKFLSLSSAIARILEISKFRKNRLKRLFSINLSPHFEIRVPQRLKAISGCYPSQKLFALGVHFP